MPEKSIRESFALYAVQCIFLTFSLLPEKLSTDSYETPLQNLFKAALKYICNQEKLILKIEVFVEEF